MPEKVLVETRPRNVALVRITGMLVVVLSVAGLAVGLLLSRSLGDDLRSTVSVSRSALVAIDQTIEAVDLVAADTAASLEAAAGSVESASTTVEGAVDAIEELVTFLDEELPATIESIQSSMPAAIQTANAIDGTLSALSFFGVDYDPDQPFGESLADVNAALSRLPSELSAQSESLRLLTPSAQDLADETGALAGSMGDLTDSLEGFSALTGSYETTLAEAEVAIDRTDESVESSLWMIRALVVGMALAGVAVGISLLAIARSLGMLHTRTAIVETREEEVVEA